MNSFPDDKIHQDASNFMIFFETFPFLHSTSTIVFMYMISLLIK